MPDERRDSIGRRMPDELEVLVMILLTGLLLTAVSVIALYAFGVFNSPCMHAFRIAFYHSQQDAIVGAAK